MKHLSISILLLIFITTFISCNDDSIFNSKVKTVNGITTVSGIRPGGLEKALFLRLSSVSHLVISDTIDSRDFATMRDLMPNLTDIDLSNATIAAYNGFEGTAGTSNYYYPANAIPEFAFYSPVTSYSKLKLKSFLFPKSIKSIRDFAFNHCSGLTGTLNIPASVIDTIGRSAFSFCDGLTAIKLSAVSYIGESAFQNCSNLTGTLVIPDSVFIINDWAFSYCDKINVVKIPKTDTIIGVSAFNGCSGQFTVDAKNTAFSSMDGVLFNSDKSVLIQFPTSKTGVYSIPSVVGEIGTFAFANCTGLTSVIIPTTTYSIGSYAFSGCSGLVGTFPISSGISFIGRNVFIGCSGITSFNIAPDNTMFSFSNGVLLDLGQMLVKHCITSKTGSYIIPADILYIDYSAFCDCNQLTSITIPETVSEIGPRAFANCTALTSIYAKSPTPIDLTRSTSAFESVNTKTCTLYVPIGAKASYKSTFGWLDFRNIVEN